jgi:hypothetical protein
LAEIGYKTLIGKLLMFYCEPEPVAGWHGDPVMTGPDQGQRKRIPSLRAK